MGLSIHYSGQIKAPELLPYLIEEVKDIAEIYKWKYHIYDAVFSKNSVEEIPSSKQVYGISFTPTNCETISLTFLRSGVMICPIRLFLSLNPQDEQEQIFLNTISVKTQYAGVELHQFIIHLLKYLNDKYFSNFIVNDESEYWETGDEEKMKNQFKKYNELVENFALAIETFPSKNGEDMIAYFERLMKKVNDLNK
ncbi:hypothetical protein [Pedobacter frigiditerrae]|uniref:hypothetical protein n=1 Tax=Pedobacter frigiditerrae TaxID=2530452 RepID=UPI00292DE61F|nr:hypothetical protein [Pedobacter frigiditerrae]